MSVNNREKAERNAEIYEMYLDGQSVTQIAKEFQVSKQRVSQIIQTYKTETIGNKKLKDIIYPNIRRWMLERHMSFYQFYGVFVTNYKHHISDITLLNFLRGKSKGNIEVIKRILEITRLTFEEAFATEKKRKSKKQIGSEKQCL